MTIQTANLIVVAHLPRHLRALVRGREDFENVAEIGVADGVRDQLLSASAEFLSRLETAKQPDPWRFGFGVIHKSDNILMGMGGFPGPPNDGIAEIAYGIAPAYQGRGYATELANVLIDFVSADESVRVICAHTLREINASTRILEKCGFKKVDDAIDPENNLPIWRWEREKRVSSRTT